MQDQRYTPPPPTSSPLVRTFRPLARAWHWATGFHIEGRMPDLEKYVIIGAPHTTNWDLPHALAAGLHYGLRIHWIGKESIFKWPFGGLMRWLGGISVDRSKSTNAVDRMVEEFKERDQLHLVIAPQGTRNSAKQWRSGFYHIANGAKVPIVLVFIDYTRKVIGIADVFHPTGDYESDIRRIEALYARHVTDLVV